MATRTSAARRTAAAAVAVVCAALAALVNPPPASACSCAVGDPSAALAAADAAFVGTLATRRESNRGPVRSSADPVTLGFRVERVLKGDLGDRVDVVTAASCASCGIEAEIGRRLILLLTRARGQWTSGLCDQLAAERLDVHSFTVEDEDRARWWLVLAAAGAMTAVAAAVFVLVRRRRAR